MGYRHRYESTLRRRRLTLTIDMGGRCIACQTCYDLEFHHPRGRSWKPNQHSKSVRLRKYRQDWEDGNLELMCKYCNRNPQNHPEDCSCFMCRL